MKGKIISYPWSNNSKMDSWLKEHAGQWIEIETECLFTDQYNTSIYRLYDTHFQAMQDDARICKGCCKYCGNIITVDKVICMKYAECPSHGVEWWTAKNCFFIANPSGVEQPTMDEIKIGTYTLSSNEDHYTLRNCRKRIDFKYNGSRFWEISIGYIGKKFLDVPISVHFKLISVLKEHKVSA